ncbi:hypothetical protein GGH12_004587 [Coemansia sp. RSA 1822]|nr:hypothetical protein LPJ76_002430 [Coemansia sp. RSA 638]KAJ2544256.1 hypothetical protein GGF49_001364 [Coemansia sp. RSA 1853]KAJ2560719.1 hypothetical protein GGH12_004587 [Coemansia sp. RSA 1822]
MDGVYDLLRPLNLCLGFSAYAAYRVFHALYISPLRNVPGPFWCRVSALPMLYYDLRGQEPEFMQRNCQKYGSIFVMEPSKVAVCGLSECQTVLNSHGFLKDKQYARVKFIEPNMFLTRSPELNRLRRRQIGGALQPHSLRGMEPVVLGAGAQQLMRKWDSEIAKNGQVRVQYFSDFSDMAFDVICSLGFGLEHRSLTTKDRKMATWVRKATLLMFVEIMAPILSFAPFKQAVFRGLRASVNKFLTFGVHTIEQRKREVEESGERRNDILQAFIDAEDPQSKTRMTADQIASETVISMLAGTDTTANTLSWALHLLLLHPQHMQRAQQEVRDQFAPSCVIGYEAARAQLPFLEACVYEALRLRAPANNLPRTIARGGVVLRRHFIPDHCTVSVSIHACNTNAETWDRPLVFDPERFINCPEQKRMVLTFSAGVRVCPGRHLAMWEIVTTLANVLNNYELELPSDAVFTPKRTDGDGPVAMPYHYAITCSPKYPDRDCIVMVSKRE